MSRASAASEAASARDLSEAHALGRRLPGSVTPAGGDARAGARAPLRATDLWALTAAALALALAWFLADVLLLFFAGVLLSLALGAAVRQVQHWTRWPRKPALLLVVVLLGGVVGSLFLLTGGAAAEQVQALRDTLPRAQAALLQWLDRSAMGRVLVAWGQSALQQGSGDLTRDLAGLVKALLGFTVNAVGALLLALVLALYLAADPKLYVDGALRLLPARRRSVAAHALHASGDALRRWLLGQAVTMAVVGALTTAGLMLIGLPLAATLGVIAALLELVPYFGPMVTALLVGSVALADSPALAWQALLVCLVVQQVEALLVQPLAQRWAVRMPAVLVLLAVLIFGLLFGLSGALLAMPLMVLTATLVKQWRSDP